MQQLTIFCSCDDEDLVVSILQRSGIEGYLRIGHASASRFVESGPRPRKLTWEASVFVVPAEKPEPIRAAVKELRDYAGHCEVDPCLRYVVSSIDASG